jgi:hypothetical protein
MGIANYTDLKTSIADWLNRGDLEQQIPDFITLAEATLNKVVRHNRMVATGTVTVNASAQKATAPTDMLEPIFVQVQSDPDAPIEQISINQLIMLRRNRMRATGTPRFFALVGRELQVTPVPSGNTTLEITYYQMIPALTVGAPTNWLLTYDPDIYLYTSLMHAAPFLRDDARTVVMENLVSKQILSSVNQNRAATFESVRVPGFSLDAPSDPRTPPAAGGGPAGSM